jgi:spermidine/putrescine transport system ATP-binding protein
MHDPRATLLGHGAPAPAIGARRNEDALATPAAPATHQHHGGAAADVRLVDLRKDFGEVAAVDGVTLEIRAGEFFSLLGPSGCGKTTTLRMIGGFELPTSGRILLGEREITGEPPERRPVNMVFQSYALFPHLNVFENVAFGLRRRRTPEDEVRDRVGHALELVRLGGYERRKTDQLSGGQQQRVALARALVNRPQVLLLDEPLGALDLKLRRELQVELKRVQLEVGITFVYVTHDQEEALALSDRIAVMDRGRVEQVGGPEELYDAPRTLFVAGFIGTSNLLAGTIDSLDGGDAVIRLEAGLRCLARAGAAHPGDPVHVAVRPEAIVLERDAPDSVPDEGPQLRGTIQQSAYLGTSVSHIVATDAGVPLQVVVPRSHERYTAGDAVRLRWRAADAMVLARPGAGSAVEDMS